MRLRLNTVLTSIISGIDTSMYKIHLQTTQINVIITINHHVVCFPYLFSVITYCFPCYLCSYQKYGDN